MADSPIWVDSDPELEEEEEEDHSAAAYPSVCTSSSAEKFAETYDVPPEYGLCAPRAEERAHAPPPGYAAVYTQYFQHGLKLPLQPFVASVLAHYEITLAQLHPNSIFFILGFLEICRKSSVIPTVALFRRFFRFQKSWRANGWYAFQSKRPKIVPGKPGRLGDWRTSFLYFKTAPMTENLNLSWNWNYSQIADSDGPSAETINRILSYVKGSRKHKKGVKKMSEADSTTASAPKKAAGEMHVKKSSVENETCSQRSPATLKPNTTSTESPSATCRQERLNRKAEFDAKTLRGPAVCSQVPSVPSSKDMTLDQLATYNQKFICSLHSQLQGDNDELQKAVDSLKAVASRLQGAREESLKGREKEIASLEGDKEELQKAVDSLKAEVFRLQGAREESLKDREKKIASLEGDKDELQKAVDSLKAEVSKLQAAREESLKDREKEIASLKGDKDELQKALDSLQAEVSRLQAARKESLKDMKSEIASLQKEKEDVEKENASLKAEMSKLQSGSDNRGPFLKAFEKVIAAMEQEAKDKDEEIGSLKSQLKSVVDDQTRLKSVVDHLLSLPKIPTSSQLKHLEVDEDRGSLIAPPPPQEPAMG